MIYVKCDHITDADRKMGRSNEIEIIDDDGELVGYVHTCGDCHQKLPKTLFS